MIEDRTILDNLFSIQLYTLMISGCPMDILYSFEEKRDEVVTTALSLDIPSAYTPFLPVIRIGTLNITELMFLIKVYGYPDSSGVSRIDVNDLYNIVDFHIENYYIYGINYGIRLFGNSQSNKNITFEEAVSLSIHTNILDKFSINCFGTLNKDETMISEIKSQNQLQPTLCWREVDNKNFQNSCAPLCMKRK